MNSLGSFIERAALHHEAALMSMAAMAAVAVLVAGMAIAVLWRARK